MTTAKTQTESTGKSRWLRRSVRFFMVAGIVVAFCLLLLPGPWGRYGNRRRHNASAAIEITRLSQALNSFAAKFGDYPPSSVTIYERAEMWSGDALSRAKIRRIWPRFNFEKDLDLNADGDSDDVHELSGAECLVFFLGGICKNNGRPGGFSKNPLFPFDEHSENRSGPFMEFSVERFTDVDADGFSEYGDTITRTPYLFASQNGRRYRNLDLAVYPAGDLRNMTRVYELQFRTIDFQIISAGADGDFGVGDTFPDKNTTLNDERRAERDNITNFSDGPLEYD